jgi:hypothetical protein
LQNANAPVDPGRLHFNGADVELWKLRTLLMGFVTCGSSDIWNQQNNGETVGLGGIIIYH